MASNGNSPHHPSLATSWISLSQLSITGSPQPSMKRNITSTSTSHPTQPILLGSPKAWSLDTSYAYTIFAQTVVISNINHKNFSNASRTWTHTKGAYTTIPEGPQQSSCLPHPTTSGPLHTTMPTPTQNLPPFTIPSTRPQSPHHPTSMGLYCCKTS